MKTRKFLIFAALLPLLLLLAGCGEKQAFKPIVFVAGHSADSLTNAAGERLQGDPELGFDNDATTMEVGESYSTNLSYCFEIPRTTSLTLHSQYNPVIESASTKFLLHSDAVECQLDATYAEDGELTFEIDAESCRLRGGRSDEPGRPLPGSEKNYFRRWGKSLPYKCNNAYSLRRQTAQTFFQRVS